MNQESAMQYFSQKNGILVWLLGIIGVAMIYVGYTGERRSWLFMGAGVVLIVLCIYELINNKRHKKSGADLDKIADALAAKQDFQKEALRQLCLENRDIRGFESVRLEGYCMLPIETQPYFRKDAADGKLRSSNYQVTLFFLGSERFYVYTYVKSLVDKEKLEQGRLWRYSQVTFAQIKEEQFGYTVGTDNDAKREEALVSSLVLCDEEGNRYVFAFDRTNDAQRRVEKLCQKLTQGEDESAEMSDLSEDDLSQGHSRGLNAKEMQLGIIGNDFQEPKKR
jgi:hypothetical protein